MRRAALALGMLALLQALLPGWHHFQHEHHGLVVTAAASACACAPVAEHADESCPLCHALQAAEHLDLPVIVLPVLAWSNVAVTCSVAIPSPPGLAARWAPSPRGPPRRS